MTIQEGYAIISTLFMILMGVLAFGTKDKFNKIDRVDERSQKIETNYLNRFALMQKQIAEIQINLTTEISNTRHQILNSIQEFTSQREKDKENMRDDFPNIKFCESVHGNMDQKFAELTKQIDELKERQSA